MRLRDLLIGFLLAIIGFIVITINVFNPEGNNIFEVLLIYFIGGIFACLGIYNIVAFIMYNILISLAKTFGKTLHGKVMDFDDYVGPFHQSVELLLLTEVNHDGVIKTMRFRTGQITSEYHQLDKQVIVYYYMGQYILDQKSAYK